MAETRHIANDFDPLLDLRRTTQELLQQAVDEVIRQTPPKEQYNHGDPDSLGGLFKGPTGLAYLFLHLSVSHPRLRVAGEPPLHWARAYMNAPRSFSMPDEMLCCGVMSEKLALDAVRASVTKDLAHVRALVVSLAPALAPPPPGSKGDDDKNPSGDGEKKRESSSQYPTEMLYGRAGALYLLRMVRHFVPNSAALLERTIVQLTDRILATDDDGNGNWAFAGRRYLGLAHGDAGILAQLVLTTPPLAASLAGRLDAFLDLQLPDGNWPAVAGSTDKVLVQWCHGAPGVVMCLLSMRPFFPTLQDKIDTAIERGRQCTWEQGLLKKEPSLCHGILSNSFVFPPGPKRRHFLAMATPKKLEEMRVVDPKMFEPAAYGSKDSVLMNYWPGAAWTWSVCENETPRCIACNDI